MNSQSQSEVLDPKWDAVRRYLEALRRPIQDEIRRYPPPIPACDAHFNHLLEQRAMLSRELIRLEAASKAAASDAAVAEFVRTSLCIDDDVVRALVDETAGAR